MKNNYLINTCTKKSRTVEVPLGPVQSLRMTQKSNALGIHKNRVSPY